MKNVNARIKLVLLVAASVYVALFVLVNLAATKVKFVFMTLEMPLALVIVFSLAVGALGYFAWTKMRHLIKQAKGTPTAAPGATPPSSPSQPQKPRESDEPTCEGK